MSRLAQPAERLATGTARAARRAASRAATWVARGRRHDLTGWRAALGCWLRLAILALGLYGLWRLVRAVPAIMWLLSGVWLLIAWRAGRPQQAEEEAPEEEEEEEQPRGDAIRALLLHLIGDAPGIHLRTVLTHLQERGEWEGRTVTDMRRRLEALGIPVHRGVKVAGVPTWGVRRRDLEPLSPVESGEPSTEASTAV